MAKLRLREDMDRAAKADVIEFGGPGDTTTLGDDMKVSCNATGYQVTWRYETYTPPVTWGRPAPEEQR